MVVLAPQAVLREDLSAAAPARAGTAAPPPLFSDEQLDLYGIHELQVLEALLRQGNARPEAIEAVAEKIQHKIGWSGGAMDAGRVPAPLLHGAARPPGAPHGAGRAAREQAGRAAYSKTLSRSSTSAPSLPTRRSW